jgi:hypothetical protein
MPPTRHLFHRLPNDAIWISAAVKYQIPDAGFFVVDQVGLQMDLAKLLNAASQEGGRNRNPKLMRIIWSILLRVLEHKAKLLQAESVPIV